LNCTTRLSVCSQTLEGAQVMIVVERGQAHEKADQRLKPGILPENSPP